MAKSSNGAASSPSALIGTAVVAEVIVGGAGIAVVVVNDVTTAVSVVITKTELLTIFFVGVGVSLETTGEFKTIGICVFG